MTGPAFASASRIDDREARHLDEAFLAIAGDWHSGGIGCDEAAFDAHARALFDYQIARNEPYARFAAGLGFSPARPPANWREIPAAPSAAFKDTTLATFDVARAELEFHTSGTTAERAGKHYVERAALYDASLLAGFDRFVLADRQPMRFALLVPEPRERPHSSLGYMLALVARLRGDGRTQHFVRDDAVDAAGLIAALRNAADEGAAVCMAGTAFAFVALLDEIGAMRGGGRTLALPPGSRIVETGGFKGRTKAVARAVLYDRLSSAFGLATENIVAEYGMTELLSQYYDAPESRTQATRAKGSPPWLRSLVVNEGGREVLRGEIGFLRHVDLANRSSVVALDTEDRGYAVEGGIVLLGRDEDAALRGCSLDAEDLRRRA